MEYEKIKQLMEDMGDSKLSAIEIDFPDGTKIRMKKEAERLVEKNSERESKIFEVSERNIETSSKIESINAITATDVGVSSKIDESDAQNKKIEGNIVKSPMVGTFYLKPSPTSEAYTRGRQKSKSSEKRFA